MSTDSTDRMKSSERETVNQDPGPVKGPNRTEELQKTWEEKRPNFYCRIVVNHPMKCFAITLICHVAMVILSGILLGAGFDLFPTNFKQIPMELYEVPYKLREDAWFDRNDYNNRFTRTLPNRGYSTYERDQLSEYSSVLMYYDTGTGNIFTKANLQKMKNIEQELASTQSFPSICMAINSSLSCQPFRSVLRYFDGTFMLISATLYDPEFNNIPAVLYEAYTNNNTKEDFKYFLPIGYSLSSTHAHGSLTRSILPVGCSLNGTTECSKTSWVSEVLYHLQNGIQEKLENDVTASTDDFNFYFFSYNLWFSDLIRQAILDMLCAFGSMFVIFCFMLFHTESFWIAGFAIISILASFLGTNIIYTGILSFKYFGFFHIASIFIILGIGADDLFVFYDNWRLTAFSKYPSLAHRLSDAYSKSVTSMFITSLTTSLAFFSCAISPLLATRSFGIFTGLLVIYNYLSVILFFPTVIIVYHLKYEKWTCPCCRKCKKDEHPSEETKTERSNQVFSITNVEDIDVSNTSGRNDNVSVRENSKSHTKRHSLFSKRDSLLYTKANAVVPLGLVMGALKTFNSREKQRRMTVFFKYYYLRFITHRITRCVAIPIFAILVAYLAYSASNLEPDNEQILIYKKSHYYTQAITKEWYSFEESADTNLVTVVVVWGLSLKDRSSCHFSAVECRGTEVYDSTFDPNPPANQQALKEFCDSFYNMSSSDISLYRIKTDDSGNPDISCFTREFDTYFKSLSIGGLDLSLPWDSNKTLSFMNNLSTYYNTTGYSTYTDFLSIPMQYWMYAGYSGNYTADYGVYNDLFGEEKTTFSRQLKTDSSIYYGNKIKYIGVSVKTTVNRRTTGYSTGIPIVERWESLIQSKMSAMPVGVNNGFQQTRGTWHLFYVIQTLVQNALLGIVIGVCIAFPILSLSTMNVVIGFLATFSICCTTVCVIGVIPLAGWKLGFMTALNMCLVVGLAVDYVVHLAEGYTLSVHKDRYNRTRDMLEMMGSSVFFGACTTLGASLFLFATEIQFFLQFGVFMFCTIGFSLMFSLGLFTLLVGLIGPQNNTGNLKVLFQKCRLRFQR
ncbi:protein dispatched homolog 3-like [Saccostrea echinata]|uniref:protein dispatched homolog 3-like n=1 Tax=Saccostrea echinata TaxID=191078 RepID=UPI002A8016DD|nr:protein dispatched homolog 3-like [Saccostrea echinata]